MLKTCTGGYDGKGQRPIRDAQDLAQVLPTLPAPAASPSSAQADEWVLEQFVSFTSEASVIVARTADGEMAAYPMGENIHRDNVLYATIVPARIGPSDQSEGVALARAVAQKLKVVGLLAVEMFVTPAGLIINELAPRPHNSGHYTWDACFVSQFEQFIRATCGLALGPTELLTPVVMVNILGEHLNAVLRRFAELPGTVRPHLYGKTGSTSPKRKMGHLTIKTADPARVLEWMDGLLFG
jgi:5-(carboxyamino)imidazole ribonucleotide synthase